jgi:hypothetical protein
MSGRDRHSCGGSFAVLRPSTHTATPGAAAAQDDSRPLPRVAGDRLKAPHPSPRARLFQFSIFNFQSGTRKTSMSGRDRHSCGGSFTVLRPSTHTAPGAAAAQDDSRPLPRVAGDRLKAPHPSPRARLFQFSIFNFQFLRRTAPESPKRKKPGTFRRRALESRLGWRSASLDDERDDERVDDERLDERETDDHREADGAGSARIPRDALAGRHDGA